MKKLSKEQVLLLHTQLIEEFGGKLRGKERREELLSSCLDIKTYIFSLPD